MAELTAEEAEKQRQEQAKQQAMMMKSIKLQQANQVIMSTDPVTILQTMARYQTGALICNNPQISYQLLTSIYNDLVVNSELDENALKQIAGALNKAITYTNQMRMNLGFGGMPGMSMMGGFGMNPMMGMGMNPMMGGMSPMGGFGMNPMMGGMGMMGGFGMGMNPMMGQTTNKPENDSAAAVKQFIETNLKPTNYFSMVDPLVFLQMLINSGIEIDFSEDKQFGQMCSMAIACAVANLAQTNDYMFNIVYNVIAYIQQTNFQKQWSDAQKKNGNNNQQNQFMNPMMGMGMGMMGMNPMMGGMGMMGMNPMMSGMTTGFDANSGMNPMMGGMMGMNPMMGMGGMSPMGGFGMNPMMGGMQMPGMGFAGQQTTTGAIY